MTLNENQNSSQIDGHGESGPLFFPPQDRKVMNFIVYVVVYQNC